MRRRAQIEPSTLHESASDVHPSLKAALRSLDVSLEEELSRYRRLRAIQQKHLSDRKRRKSEHVLSGISQSLLPASLGGGRADVSAHSLQSKLLREVSGSQGAINHSSLLDTSTESLAIASQSAHDTIGDHSHLERLDPDQQSYVLQSDFDDHYGQEIDPNASNQIAPDDYLASSEELLRSLDESDRLDGEQEEDPIERSTPGILSSLLTPLGIGSMLLLLVSSTTLGYLITHPSSLGLWTWGDRPSDKTKSDIDGSFDPSTAPDLSAGEFQELNLNNLSTLPDASSPSGQIPPSLDPSALRNGTAQADESSSTTGSLPAVEVPSRPDGLASTESSRAATSAPSSGLQSNRTVARPSIAASPQPQSTSVPSRPAAAPSAPTTAPAASASAAASSETTTASSSNSSSDYYYVVTNYTGDRSLSQAREAVSGAYVRNFPDGARVQMGAFTEARRAEELANQLRQQGISVEIYRP